MSGGLFDFGLYFFHNAKELLARGSGPYFYLPKMESHLEARLWNDAFVLAQDALGIPQGTIKATVLIETILAAFEMDEILYELKEHSAGLNCGRWDYIFSCIKKFAKDADFLLADRSQITMTTHFMRSYSLLCIKTCHRRGAFAMGGMAAQIPVKNDPKANEEAFAKVRADKEREATDGHDGTWVAHPGMVGARHRGVRRHHARRRTRSRPASRRTCRITRGRPAGFRPARADHRGRGAHERERGRAISGSMAARQRRGADLQPHGRRRDGGDFAARNSGNGFARRRAVLATAARWTCRCSARCSGRNWKK